MFFLLLGYIDLSKRRVSAEELKKCEEKFTRGKTVRMLCVEDLRKIYNNT